MPEHRSVELRDWRGMRDQWVRLLKQRTHRSLTEWNRRVKAGRFSDESELKRWLETEGVRGYPQMLLVMERFGYPDSMLATANELVDAQYADRPGLRPIYEAVIAAASAGGSMAVQARKTYVSLVGAKRTFARVRATTRSRVDLGLRLAKPPRGPRFLPASIHESLTVEIRFTSVQDVDATITRLLRRAIRESEA